jgi:hypothetical protein
LPESALEQRTSLEGIFKSLDSRSTLIRRIVVVLVSAMPQRTGDFDSQIDRNAQQMLKQGKQIFRYDTFGDEIYWTDTLKLHRAIEGQKLGGVGPGVSVCRLRRNDGLMPKLWKRPSQTIVGECC